MTVCVGKLVWTAVTVGSGTFNDVGVATAAVAAFAGFFMTVAYELMSVVVKMDTNPKEVEIVTVPKVR